jgi:hypothetical protein
MCPTIKKVLALSTHTVQVNTGPSAKGNEVKNFAF